MSADDSTTVYVDTCVVGTVVDAYVPEAVLSALERICEAESRGHITLVTSEETMREVLKHGDRQKRAALHLVYALGRKAPWQNPVVEKGATWGSFTWGSKTWGALPKYDELLNRLRAVFDENDARHVFQAVKAGCTYFLTLDARTVLTRAKDHPELVPQLRFVDPVELARDLAGVGG